MTITEDQVESYRRSWFPLHKGLTAEQLEQRAVLFWRALGRQPGLTASQHGERAELFRRVVGERPSEMRSRTDPYRAEIGRLLDAAQARRASGARQELAASLRAADRAADRALTASLDRRIAEGQAAADRALTASLDRRIAAALERKRRLTPTGPIRIY